MGVQYAVRPDRMANALADFAGESFNNRAAADGPEDLPTDAALFEVYGGIPIYL